MISVNIKKIFSIQIFIFFGWISMWVSINSMPGELTYMNNNITTFVNGMRTIFAVIFSCLTIILATYLLIKDNDQISSKSIILKIFLIYFISQIIGLILNQERMLDLNNIYLVLYALCTISIFYILEKKKFQNLILPFMYFVLFILILSIIFIIFSSHESIFKLFTHSNLYNLLHPDKALAYQAPPRITGFSRTIAIINIFLITFFLINKKKYYSYILIICIYFLSLIIWWSQSRGTIICFYISSAILIFFFNNIGIFKKILLYLSVTLFAVISSNYIFYINDKYEISEIYITKNLPDNKNQINKEKKITTEAKRKKRNESINNEILNIDNSRFISEKSTSGRTTLWRLALSKYDTKRIFGYGPQADRIILMKGDNIEIYGNNVSNALIYGLLSGGYLSFICLLIIYFYFSYLVISFLIREKLYKFSFELNKRNSLYVMAIIFCIFFLIRSLVENSFSVFSIDFLITIISLFLSEQFIKKNTL